MAADAFSETTSTIKSAERREMNMALRVPMLVLLSGTFVGGVAAIYTAPKILPEMQQPAATQSEAPALALTTSAEAASSPQMAEFQPVREASSSASCKEAAWPYRDRSCTADAAPTRPERQVRVISTDRDAPARVPVPTSVVAQADPVQTAPRAAPEHTAAPQAAVASSDDAASRPASAEKALAAPAKAAKAETASATARIVETTSSIRPAGPGPVARNRMPTPRQVARVERPRRDMSERIRQARRNFDDAEDAAAQTTTYQYTDGRQLVFRSEPQRRRWQAYEQAAPMPRVEPRPAHDSIFGWLGQFED
jgi:hypothetical protein